MFDREVVISTLAVELEFHSLHHWTNILYP